VRDRLGFHRGDLSGWFTSARRKAGQSKRQASIISMRKLHKISGSAGWKVTILNKINGDTRLFSQKVSFHFV
jgi:hypothetical protein